VNAIAILFKSFVIFNLKYPTEASLLYNFIEMIFGINKTRKRKNNELYNLLVNDEIAADD
jgi:hypothetical protein